MRLILLLFTHSCINLFSQSTSEQDYLNNPYGGELRDIELCSNGLLFVNTLDQVFRSFDSGVSWENCLNGNSISDIVTEESLLVISDVFLMHHIVLYTYHLIKDIALNKLKIFGVTIGLGRSYFILTQSFYWSLLTIQQKFIILQILEIAGKYSVQ